MTLIVVLLSMLLVPGIVRAQDARRLDPVVVTATKIETPQSELGAAVTVITEDEIRAHNVTRIEEVLRAVPGVVVQRSGSLGTTTTLRMRGMSSSQVQVLVDGMRVKSPTLGQVDLSEFPLDAIERIEIVRGPQSTLHGTDAMAGVVNIITKKGQGPPRGFVVLEGGSYDTFREQVGVSGSHGPFNYSFSATRHDSSGQFENDDFEQTGFGGRAGFVFPWKGELSLSGRYSKLYKEVPISSVNPTIYDPNAKQQTEMYLYNVTYEQRPLSFWQVKARYGQWWNNQGFQDPPPPSDPFGGDDITLNAFANPRSQINTRRREFELVNSLRVASWNTLMVGGQHLHERGENRSTCSPLLGVFGITSECDRGTFVIRREFNTGSLFAQDEIRLFDRLILSGGLRFDHHDQFRNALTPRASGVFSIKETGTRLRAAWGEGYRTPTINDLMFPGFGSVTVKPERSESYEFGFDQELRENRIRFGATGFHNEFRNLITFVCDPTGVVCSAGNQGGARTLGVETYAAADPFDWLSLWGNATYTRARRASRTFAGDGPELANSPRYLWNAGFTVTPVPVLSLFAQTHVESSALGFAGRKPGYHRIDVGGTYRVIERAGILEKIELTARVENVTGERYEELQGFRALGLTAIAGLRASFR